MNRLIPDETFEAGVRLREDEGLTVKAVAQRLGGSRGSWNWHFLSRGVERYGRSPIRCPRKGPLDDKILELRQRKYSYAKIGALLGAIVRTFSSESCTLLGDKSGSRNRALLASTPWAAARRQPRQTRLAQCRL